MPQLKLTNNANGRLAASITAASTTINLAPGNGALFPALTGSDHFPATLIAVDGSIEIVDVTARAGDVLTVTRAQEGTAARAFAAGDRFELRLTAGALQAELERLMAALEDAVTSASIIAALGYAPYNSTNPAGYQTAAQVTSALGVALLKAGGIMTGQLQSAVGSQAAPGIAFAGDTDTGFFRQTDGTIGISCNGVLVGRFTPTGLEAIKITQTA